MVSDEKMPGMSGAELLSLIQQKYPLTVRIMLTGQADIQAAARAINEGKIYRFLIKPCYEDLAVTIRQALQQRTLMVESNKLLKLAQQQADFIDEITEVRQRVAYEHPSQQSLFEQR
ncbi:MAG: response regulator [Planctomycetes bacterium]|nr:response regulator [Planctomycetota bacterium]